MVKSLPANARDTGSIPGLGRSTEGGNGNPLYYFCLDNPMDRGEEQAIVHRVAKSQTYTCQGKWVICKEHVSCYLLFLSLSECVPLAQSYKIKKSIIKLLILGLLFVSSLEPSSPSCKISSWSFSALPFPFSSQRGSSCAHLFCWKPT